MDSRKTHRLESWVSVLVTVLIVVGLTVVWSVFYKVTQGDKEQSLVWESEQLNRATRVLSGELGHLMGESRLALDLLTGQIRFHPDRDPLADPEFLALVKTVRDHHQGELDLVAVDWSGNVKLLEPGAQALVSVADRTYFRVQVPYPGAGFFLDEPVRSRTTGRWSVVMSEAVPPNRGQLAVLLVNLDFSHLDRFAETLVDENHDSIGLFRSDGTLLYQHPLSPTFPRTVGSGPMDKILKTGKTAGLVKGPEWFAYQQVSFVPAWVVVSQKDGTLGQRSELWTWVQLRWVLLLTLALILSGGGLLYLLRKLRQIHLEQEKQARTDPLTGLLNRRSFREQCDLEQLRATRHPAPLGLLLLDIDFFKRVNDRFGHQTGDRILKEFSGVLTKVLRATDTVARIGGEEFAVLLPATAEAAARETAERVRAGIETILLPDGHLTTSIGLSLWDGSEPVDSWYQRTDQALYRAKTGGRNRVELAILPDRL